MAMLIHNILNKYDVQKTSLLIAFDPTKSNAWIMKN